jgi:two-component system, cell cycle sensor histidine kinase and response regulator CckA
VAHDLNNLLTPVLGYTDMLREEGDLSDTHHDYIEQINFAAKGARSLVRQLLAFGRKQTLQYRVLDLNRVVIDFEKLLRRTLREDIDFHIHRAGGPLPVKADRGQIEQVIMNLVVNAQDAMPHGGRLTLETHRAEIDTAVTEERPDFVQGDYVLLKIVDSGVGMDKEELEHVFEPFYSTKGDQGTGLGLATVFGIVKQHGGNTTVHSERSVGTTFEIYLPVSQETQQTPEEKPALRSVADLRGSESILIVEDNDAVRRLASSILTSQGYIVHAAGNIDDSLKIIEGNGGKIDLLLTDVMTPNTHEKDLHHIILDLCPDVKVLFMSGYAEDVLDKKGVAGDRHAFIQKPLPCTPWRPKFVRHWNRAVRNTKKQRIHQ